MAALDGKITIERELRPCIVKNSVNALFHCWNFRSRVIGESYLRGGHPAGQISATFAIVEYEDGTIHEVEPTQIRFVDNVMKEYTFPEMEKNTDKVKNEWKPLKRVNHVCPKCGQGRMKLDEGIVLTSNPPQYRYQCDKCGYVECSSGQIKVSDIDEYEPR